jgi:hypothetical protein
MSFLSKWTLGGGLAVAALVAAFSLFGGSAQAGLDDPGELILGDLECEKDVISNGEFGDTDIIQGDVVTFTIDCEVNIPAFDERPASGQLRYRVRDLSG